MLFIAYTLRFALINLSKTTNIEALQTQKHPTLGLSLLYISRIRDFLLDLLKDQKQQSKENISLFIYILLFYYKVITNIYIYIQLESQSYAPFAFTFVKTIEVGLEKLNKYFLINIEENYEFYKPYLFAIILDPRLNIYTIRKQLKLSSYFINNFLLNLKEEYKK